MASMKIHQDLYNFERKRKGFTPRQLKALRNGIFVAVLCAALFGYALELPQLFVWCIVPCAAIVPIMCGSSPYGTCRRRSSSAGYSISAIEATPFPGTARRSR